MLGLTACVMPCWRNRNHVLRLAVSQQRGHAIAMWTIDVSVGAQNQFPAVSVCLPTADRLHVDATFKAARDKHPAKTSSCELRDQSPIGKFANESEPLARIGDCLACPAHREQTLVRLLARTKFFH